MVLGGRGLLHPPRAGEQDALQGGNRANAPRLCPASRCWGCKPRVGCSLGHRLGPCSISSRCCWLPFQGCNTWLQPKEDLLVCRASIPPMLAF